MRSGAPSVNPSGRPPVGLALSNAVRARFPPDVIVAMAEHILKGDAPADIKLKTLEFLAKRGWGPITSPALQRRRGIAVTAAEKRYPLRSNTGKS